MTPNYSLLIALVAISTFVSAAMLGLVYAPGWTLLIATLFLVLFGICGWRYAEKPDRFPSVPTLTPRKRAAAFTSLVAALLLPVHLYPVTLVFVAHVDDWSDWAAIPLIVAFSLILGVGLGQLFQPKTNNNGATYGSR
ncbi:hypothetical protein [Maricaulis sp.]|uniref:hypothetical protein n=1 Tax=Maricaulis sp. TaxID=1486257 RepID=UPI003A93C0B3